jgi:hypothetical protein
MQDFYSTHNGMAQNKQLRVSAVAAARGANFAKATTSAANLTSAG